MTVTGPGWAIVGILAAGAVAGATNTLAQPAGAYPCPTLASADVPPPAAVSETRVLVRLAPGATIRLVGGSWLLSSPVSAPVSISGVLEAAGQATIGPALTVKPADATLAASVGLNRDVLVALANPGNTRALAASLAAIPGVESAAPEPIGALLAGTSGTRLPTDPLIPQQYALENEGQVIQGVPGVPGADTGALEAWAKAGPLAPVTAAVLDSGVAGTHPDLAPAMVPGWNVATGTGQSGDEIVSHGTHVAGIIGAAHNNWGIAGLCPAARIMPVKVTNTYGTTGAAWVASGVVWAADHGARVLNISIGFTTDNPALHAAIQYAAAKGCLVVCSAGNSSTGPIAYPARYPEAIAVGAIDNRDLLWPQSATGPELDLVAPGVGVLSTWHKAATPNTHAYRDGTSQASPHVAGVAALVWGAAPSLSAAEVRLILEVSARDLGAPGRDPSFGHGCIDASRAVDLARIFANPTAPAKGSCRVDLNRDGVVSSGDFYLFIEWYAHADPRADFAAPFGVISGGDFFQFTLEYSRGCVMP